MAIPMGDQDYFMTCNECGIRFAVPASFDRWCREDSRRTFYCPRGHSLHYSGKDNDIEKMRRERDRLKQETAYLSDQYRDAREAREIAERRATAFKGHLTRTKKRIAAGTCPCCKRHFTNLERHMHAKHPEFADSEPDDNVVEFKSA